MKKKNIFFLLVLILIANENVFCGQDDPIDPKSEVNKVKSHFVGQDDPIIPSNEQDTIIKLHTYTVIEDSILNNLNPIEENTSDSNKLNTARKEIESKKKRISRLKDSAKDYFIASVCITTAILSLLIYFYKKKKLRNKDD